MKKAKDYSNEEGENFFQEQKTKDKMGFSQIHEIIYGGNNK